MIISYMAATNPQSCPEKKVRPRQDTKKMMVPKSQQSIVLKNCMKWWGGRATEKKKFEHTKI